MKSPRSCIKYLVDTFTNEHFDRISENGKNKSWQALDDDNNNNNKSPYIIIACHLHQSDFISQNKQRQRATFSVKEFLYQNTHSASFHSLIHLSKSYNE